MNQENIIKIKDVCKDFKVGNNSFRALNKINLEIDRGEFVGLVGPSGSGKTTLLNIIGSLDTPTLGEVFIGGKTIQQLKPKKSAELRNKEIGFIFQNYNLLPVYNVFENVEYALLLQNIAKQERKKMVEEALEWVGLTDKIRSRPNQLSGGECQRVAIARAIVKRPEIVLADEPSANLDSKNSYNILDTMKKLNEQLSTTFVFATHDEKVMSYLKRIVRMEDGKIVKDEMIGKS